jgi:hypothetical protein
MDVEMSFCMFVLEYYISVYLEIPNEECQKNKLWMVALGAEGEP